MQHYPYGIANINNNNNNNNNIINSGTYVYLLSYSENIRLNWLFDYSPVSANT